MQRDYPRALGSSTDGPLYDILNTVSGLAWLLLGILITLVFVKRKELFHRDKEYKPNNEVGLDQRYRMAPVKKKTRQERQEQFKEDFIQSWFTIAALLVTNPIFALFFFLSVIVFSLKIII